MRRFSIVLVLVSLLQVGSAARGQSPAPDRQQSTNTFTTHATAILVDVVVRDKKGGLVTDLSQSDFDVAEDGVRQKIGSFAVVNHGGGIGIGVKFRQPGGTTVLSPTDAAGSESAPPAPLEPAMTALVFDALSPEALSITQKAALGYVPMVGESDARIGVFGTEPALKILQTYTSDLALVRKGIREVTATGTSAKDLKADQKRDVGKQLAMVDSQTERILGAAGGGGANLGEAGTAIGQLEMQQKMLESQKHMLDAFESIDRDHRGYSVTSALQAVLMSMSDIGGRTTVVLFSEGLPASPAMRAQLSNIIEAANRSNISIYTVDANGLRSTSTLNETREQLQATVDDRLRQISFGRDTSDGPYTKGMERTEDMLALDPQGGLATLAQDTGGFLIRDTNDIGQAFRRIEEDSRFHYLLSYSPLNTALDGKFRTIAVKVNRPNIEVFSRKGYRAMRNPGLAPGLGYEAPALALLDHGVLPNAFPIRAGGLVFPDRQAGATVPIIVKVNTESLQFETDQARGTYSGQVAVVVRIKDQRGTVVQKMSQQYVLSGDAKDVEAAKKGEILFYRQPLLPPGFFEVEAIAYDVVGQKGSARVSTITVPSPKPDSLELSSLVIVGRTERVSGTEVKTGAPLYYGDVLMYPNLGDPVSRANDKELSFYVSLYPAVGHPVRQVMLELLHNGQRVANGPLTLGKTLENRIQHVGRLPLDGVPPGTYELKVTASDDQTERTRSTFFTVGS
jgi:VWFA-related protein